MHIEKLSLINFKNYEEASLNFSGVINCILGENGSGKTNLLDAIYYLSTTKSYFNSIDSQNIKFGTKFFSIKGIFIHEAETYQVACSLKEGEKKAVKVNGAEYEKLREHIGRFPAIIVTPYDTDLVREGSEIRRKFVDQIISQTNRIYLDTLIEYNQYLKQRNSLLKRFAETQRIDKLLLEPYDVKLIELGRYINQVRSEFLEPFKAHFVQQYNDIAEKQEKVDIQYDSGFNKPEADKLFYDHRTKDLALQRTTFGIHKDDFKFTIKDRPLKKFGSQGQQKSFVIGLKLAHFITLKAFNNFPPILLLDDIFDKLDSSRIEKLLHKIADNTYGQVFITDARAERTKDLLNTADIEANFYEISNGEAKAL